MQRSHIVRPAAMFWGLVVFMPVGVTYLSAILLLVTMLVAGGAKERFARLRANPLWWPVMAYVAWTLVVLALRPHYPQTPSNLFHGLRIAATLLMAMALAREEAVWALRGFLAMAAVNIVMIALYYTVGFPMLEPWRGVLILIGNKSISNALLFTIVAATAAVYGISQMVAHRPWRAIPAFAVVLAVVAIITLTLPSRTSLLALLLVIPAACVHQWRRQLRTLAVALVAVVVVLGAGVSQLPSVQQKFALGVQEIEAAQGGVVSEGSWVVRYYMYRDTARMIIDKPLAGWGIGGWTDQWHKRGPALLADYNMPHNDFLWMGAQAGLPGLLALLVIMVSAVWQAWRRPDLAGRYAFAATLIALIATSVNSALRDAQIGLALLWIAMVFLRLAQETQDPAPWRDLWPRRRVAANETALPNVLAP
ncbi:O-antigen ligase family protein [Variovorax boronicumulans]|uniref:O-antigen ligase family protein n=1 Tax=Variovorax boronicumulans TaxID=436515 RepID=UPI003398114C